MDVFPGFLSLIFVTISFFVAIKIVIKYFEVKNKIFIYVGVSWIGLGMPWLTDAISSILILTINTALNAYAKVIIELAFLPFFLITWLTGFTELLYKERQIIIISISIVLGIVFEIILFTLMYLNFSLIGTLKTAVDIEYSFYILIYLFSFMGIFLITGIKFGLKTLKTDDPVLKLKGKFIIAAFISFTIGALLDALISIHLIWIIVIRAILISSSIEYYLGFILPEKVKNLILKKS